MLLFLSLKKKNSDFSVVQENAAILFFYEAPKLFCGLQNLILSVDIVQKTGTVCTVCWEAAYTDVFKYLPMSIVITEYSNYADK